MKKPSFFRILKRGAEVASSGLLKKSANFKNRNLRQLSKNDFFYFSKYQKKVCQNQV